MHPFVAAFADFVVERVEDVEGIKDKIFSDVKDISIVDRAIDMRELNLNNQS